MISGRFIRRRLIRLASYLNLKSLGGLANTHATVGSQMNKNHGKYYTLPVDQCAICAENASFSLNLTDPTNAFSSLSAQAPSVIDPSSLSLSGSTESEDIPPAYPLYTPYRASCGDVYCYHCITERMMRASEEGEICECLRCGEVIRSADRHVIGNGNGSDVSGSEFEFSDIDVTDLSASVGSYSE